MKNLAALFLMSIALGACGTGGGSGTNDSAAAAPVTGVATPGAVSVVQAN